MKSLRSEGKGSAGDRAFLLLLLFLATLALYFGYKFSKCPSLKVQLHYCSFNSFFSFSFFLIYFYQLEANYSTIGDRTLIPRQGISPGEGNGYPFQYSCLENSMEGYSPWDCEEFDTSEQLTLSLSLFKVYAQIYFFACGCTVIPEPFAEESLCSPDSTDGKESACNAGDPGLIPGLGISPEEGKGNPLQYSCLENTMDRRAWLATVRQG